VTARTTGRLLNYALYYVGWAAAVGSAARGRPWAALAWSAGLTLVHVVLARRRGDEAVLAVRLAALGLGIEALLAAPRFVDYPCGQPVDWLPAGWILGLWAQLATTLRFSLAWFAGRYALLAALGAVAGPLAFRAGELVGAVELPRGMLSLTALAAAWAVALPLAMRWAEVGRARPGAGEYRISRAAAATG
jgi:hypothetical protein